MSDNENIEVLDLRENFFKISNHIFDEGINIDCYEFSVYGCLCRFTNNHNKESFPSITKIQNMIKLSRPKVINTLKSLIEKKLIFKKVGGTGKSNRYYLMPIPSKRELLVNLINQTSKPHLPTSKPGLPEVVNDVYPKKTNIKRLNKNTNKKDLSMFEDFWNLYDYKKSRSTCERIWVKLDIPIRELILEKIPDYVKSTPNKQYRKHPATWLNQKCWDDEVLIKKGVVDYEINELDKKIQELENA